MKAILKKDKHPFKKGEEFHLHGTVFTNGSTCLTIDVVSQDDDFELTESGSVLLDTAGVVGAKTNLSPNSNILDD